VILSEDPARNRRYVTLKESLTHKYMSLPDPWLLQEFITFFNIDTGGDFHPNYLEDAIIL
jgi:hypothetical protein